jgi:hypothetical protein
MNKKLELKHIAMILVPISFWLYIVVNSNPVIDQPTVVAQKSVIEKSMKADYMSECLTGADVEYCECTFDEVYKKTGDQKFLQEMISFELNGTFSEPFLRIVSDSIMSCI